MDLKTAAVTGAVVGTVASFVFGKSFDVEKVAKYAAIGAGAFAASSYLMTAMGGKHQVAGELTGWDEVGADWNPKSNPYLRHALEYGGKGSPEWAQKMAKEYKTFEHGRHKGPPPGRHFAWK